MIIQPCCGFPSLKHSNTPRVCLVVLASLLVILRFVDYADSPGEAPNQPRRFFSAAYRLFNHRPDLDVKF